MKITVKDLAGILDEIFPPRWSEPWDNSGLTMGRADAEARRVLVALDVTADTVGEAQEGLCDLVLTHHPFPWRDRKRYDLSDPEVLLMWQIMANNLNLFSVHTNLDAAPEGHATWLARQLGLMDLKPLKPTGERLVKLSIFAPGAKADLLRKALAGAGAGRIGHYTGCSFSSRGQGRYTPEPGAKPAIGTAGVSSTVEEEKIEVVCAESDLSRALTAARAVHPYEVMAYDVYPLKMRESDVGLGRRGQIGPQTISELVSRLKSVLGLEKVFVSGFPATCVERVAVCPGSAGDLLQSALDAQVEVFVGGEFSHHDALTAAAHGMTLIDAGHYATEAPALTLLEEACTKLSHGTVEIIRSKRERNPFGLF